jgi:peptide/nickel transport system ATP-binding protein
VATAMTALLEIRDLWAAPVRRRGHALLRGVGLRVAPGEVHGVVGESGAGKSLLGRAVLGVLPSGIRIAKGTITLDGEDLRAASPRRRRALLGRFLAMVPQDPMTALNPVRRIAAQMTDHLRLHLRLDRRQARAEAEALLAAVHIREPGRVLAQYPFELSGGMRQRVLIAMAFACRPRLVVADEPTTALDVTVQRQILRLIRELQREAGTAILFITHDLGVVAKICDRVTVLHAGRVLEEAATPALFAAPRHPYTAALMRATPRYDRPGEALEPVPTALAERLRAEAEAFDHVLA